MTGEIFGFLWGFWTITIRMFCCLAAGYHGEKTGRKRGWLFAAAAGMPMAALTCCLWQLAAALVIAAGFAAMRRMPHGAMRRMPHGALLVMAGALALAIVTAVFGNVMGTL